MGNFSGGVRSESAQVVARCPERNSRAEAQSLKPRPCFNSGFRKPGVANAPSAIIGVSLSSSRRFTCLNFRSSIFDLTVFESTIFESTIFESTILGFIVLDLQHCGGMPGRDACCMGFPRSHKVSLTMEYTPLNCLGRTMARK